MSEITNIALLGFGEVNQILARDLQKNGGTTLSAWDIKFADRGSAPSKALSVHTIRAGKDGRDAVREADLVISAVTAAQDKVAARDVAAGLKAGCWFLDLNSASPGQKTVASQIVTRADARYVEAAVMSPIGPKRIASPMLLGGPSAQAFLPLAHALGFSGAQFFASEIGRASAAKLCRSVIVKGLEAILSESLLAGRHYGVEDTVLASLSDLLPGPSWPALARYMISRTIQHGVRRAEEMREAASTVGEAGIEPLMSVACSKRQDWAPQFQAALDAKTLPAMLDAMLSRIPANEGTRDDH